jgi:site-specific DNA-cytosine methylase
MYSGAFFNMKLATICTGGGIYEQGAIAAGLTPIWGVEINPRVAEVYRLNYPDSQIVVDDVCNIDWDTLPRPDVLHASPSCRSFSTANNKVEAVKDIAVAQAVGRAIAHFLPEIFTLENVPAYQDSESWAVIYNCLQYLGYSVSYQVHKLKYWGIPQKQRNRFIAIATLNQPANLLLTPNRTRHWYEEIRDLVPDLEPSKLTNTQKDKLNQRTRSAIAEGEIVLLKRNQIRDYTPAAYESDPYCWSITATLATDQNQSNRSKFADLVTPDGIFSLNTRALARIQTIPDSYKLSGNIAIDGLVIGDGVPCYFVEQMWEQIKSQVESRKSQIIPDLTLATCDLRLKEVRSTFDQNVLNCGRFDQTDVSSLAGNPPSLVLHLAELEEVIKKYAGHDIEFFRLGKALLEIKTAKLYKQAGYKGFRAYCSDRFNLSKTYVDNLIRAISVYESVKDTAQNLPLIEAHCRSLAKIKDVKMRSQVLTQVAQKGTITAKAIESEYRHMRLDEINERSKPDLPLSGQVIRITSKQDLLSKHYNGYWGIITAKHEFTCDARVLGGYISTMHPQDFIVLSDASPDMAIALLDRLDKIICFEKANDTVRTLCIAIATRPYPLLEEMDDVLLSAVEQAEIVHNLEQAWAEPKG